MMHREWGAFGLLTFFGFSAALADDFSFEVGLAADRTTFEGSAISSVNGGSVFDSSDIDTDDLNLFGTWYFAGLSDANGPRARAAFVDRASRVSFSYVRTEASIYALRDSNVLLIPSFEGEFDTSGDSYALNGQFVSRDSGWFGKVGIASSDSSISGSVDESIDATVWSLGVGKYLWANTAISLDISQIDEESFDATAIALSFSHLGRFRNDWQYAFDFSYTRTDGDFDLEIDAWLAGLAFYPTRDIELGLRYETLDFTFDGLDRSGIEGFASWFVRPNLQLAARYRIDDVNYIGSVFIGGAPRESDADQNSYGISAIFRF